MPIDQFKPAWKYLKLQSDMTPLKKEDIVAIISTSTVTYQPTKQILLFNLAMFLLLVFCCQGG